MSTPGTAIDSLTAAMKSNIIPNQEYLLQGSVLDQYVEVLLHRLRGLCDNVDSNPESFNDHELCYSLRLNNSNPPAALPLRVRRALDVADAPYQLRYVGQQELGDKNRPTVVRSCIDMACSSTILEFLTELGKSCYVWNPFGEKKMALLERVWKSLYNEPKLVCLAL